MIKRLEKKNFASNALSLAYLLKLVKHERLLCKEIGYI